MYSISLPGATLSSTTFVLPRRAEPGMFPSCTSRARQLQFESSKPSKWIDIALLNEKQSCVGLLHDSDSPPTLSVHLDKTNDLELSSVSQSQSVDEFQSTNYVTATANFGDDDLFSDDEDDYAYAPDDDDDDV